MAEEEGETRIVGNRVAVESFTAHMYTPNFHTFFDGPDNDNFLHKNKIMLKYTSLATLFATVTDVTLLERTGVWPVVQRGLFYGIPLIGGGLTYTFTLRALSAFKQEEHSRTNHFLAGQAAGAVVGAAKKCIPTGLITGIALGVFGAAYKTSKLEGWNMFPDLHTIHKEVGYPMSYKHDMTYLPEFPQRWVREPAVSTSSSSEEGTPTS